jgi:protein SCO1/2
MAITQVLDALGSAAEGVQPIFITIDPERDTQGLADYVASFHRSFVGLTGFARGDPRGREFLQGLLRKGARRKRRGLFDRSHRCHLMGRNSEYLGFMPPQTDPAKLTEVLRK